MYIRSILIYPILSITLATSEVRASQMHTCSVWTKRAPIPPVVRDENTYARWSFLGNRETRGDSVLCFCCLVFCPFARIWIEQKRIGPVGPATLERTHTGNGCISRNRFRYSERVLQLPMKLPIGDGWGTECALGYDDCPCSLRLYTITTLGPNVFRWPAKKSQEILGIFVFFFLLHFRSIQCNVRRLPPRFLLYTVV